MFIDEVIREEGIACNFIQFNFLFLKKNKRNTETRHHRPFIKHTIFAPQQAMTITPSKKNRKKHKAQAQIHGS